MAAISLELFSSEKEDDPVVTELFLTGTTNPFWRVLLSTLYLFRGGDSGHAKKLLV